MSKAITSRPAVSREKQHGIHYTPLALAEAVALRLAQEIDPGTTNTKLVLADTACGEGELLKALVDAIRARGVTSALEVHALDRDAEAIRATCARLGLDGVDIHGRCEDFLRSVAHQGSLFGSEKPVGLPPVDLLIANPPYVRTQVLGATEAQDLAARYGLAGRVDLAYPFAMSMIETVAAGGHFAIILSNKFLTIKAGASFRGFLERETEILEVWDLGDSKLFAAAVLPVVIFGRRARGGFRTGVPFRSLYEDRAADSESSVGGDADVLTRFAGSDASNRFAWKGATWNVRVGHLMVRPESRIWLLDDGVDKRAARPKNTRTSVAWRDVLRTSVGIKTTADNVFIRTATEWRAMPESVRPERDLLHPVRLSNDVAPWCAPAADQLDHWVLYPFDMSSAKRKPIKLESYPGAAAYLERHRTQLEGRKYVIEGGREWFEPWVPHAPAKWPLPRLICRDISDGPTFAVDTSGAIPNGTIYWTTPLSGDGSVELLWAACAVANSRWCGEFYDRVVGTRLYAGRRRYNTQALNAFLLPAADADVHELANLARAAADRASRGLALEDVESKIDVLCRTLFD